LAPSSANIRTGCGRGNKARHRGKGSVERAKAKFITKKGKGDEGKGKGGKGKHGKGKFGKGKDKASSLTDQALGASWI
jgi:hypothetical protein